MACLFPATDYAGRLYVHGVSERRLVYWDEAQVDAIFNDRVGDRKARTPEELRAAVLVSRIGHPAITVWIAEAVEETARSMQQGGVLSVGRESTLRSRGAEQK